MGIETILDPIDFFAVSHATAIDLETKDLDEEVYVITAEKTRAQLNNEVKNYVSRATENLTDRGLMFERYSELINKYDDLVQTIDLLSEMYIHSDDHLYEMHSSNIHSFNSKEMLEKHLDSEFENKVLNEVDNQISKNKLTQHYKLKKAEFSYSYAA